MPAHRPRISNLMPEWVQRPVPVRVRTGEGAHTRVHIAVRESNNVPVTRISVSFQGGCGGMYRQVINRRYKGPHASADIVFSTTGAIAEGPKPAFMSVRLHTDSTHGGDHDGISVPVKYTEEIVEGTPQHSSSPPASKMDGEP
jgi:hypothetical protein